MRLRRETGDFSCVITEGAATLPKNQTAENLIGLIVVSGSTTSVVTAITDNDTTLTLTAGTASYTYTKATGAVAVVGD